MKPASSGFASGSLKLLFALGGVACLAGCATPQAAPAPAKLVEQPLTDQQALRQIRTGDAKLECDASCAEAWQHHQADLTALYDSGDWRKLGVLVLQIGYKQDLAYFYLGRAAEGLGDRSAALVYYGAAQGLATGPNNATRCAASPAGCNGLSLLTEVLTRTRIVEVARSRTPFQHASRGSAESPQPGDATATPPNASWVDPPPAGQ